MTTVREWKKIIQQLRTVLEGLPSQQERDELVTGINSVVRVLTQVSSSLASSPTAEEAAIAVQTLEKLESILERSPVLASKIQKAKKQHPTQVSATIRPSQADVQREIRTLMELPQDKIVARLKEDKRYSNEFLRLILFELGRKVSSKATKQEMIDLIGVAITTKRTYNGLSGDR